jgi:hypothetical protein
MVATSLQPGMNIKGFFIYINFIVKVEKTLDVLVNMGKLMLTSTTKV